MDITSNGGIAVSVLIGGEKSVTETVIDGVAAIGSEVVSGAISGGLNKAITGDLSAKSAATMTKETKTAIKELQKVTRSDSFNKTIETGTNFVTGSLGEVCKETVKIEMIKKTWEKKYKN